MQSYTALGKLQEAGEAEKFTYREIYKIKGTKVFNFVVPSSIPAPHFVLNIFVSQLPPDTTSILCSQGLCWFSN